MCWNIRFARKRAWLCGLLCRNQIRFPRPINALYHRFRAFPSICSECYKNT